MAGWPSASIGDICDVVNGGTPKTDIREYWSGRHNWITPAEMGKRSTPYIDQTDRTITDQGLQNSSARLLPPYSVILSSRAPIGHLVINTEVMATNQGCKGLVPRSRIDYKFLYHYLGSIVDLLNELGTGTTFKELSGGKLKEVKVPVPSIAEQRRIVAILDEAFEGIATAKANAEKNLWNARELFNVQHDAIFSKVDGSFTRLGEIASFRNGINYTKQSKGSEVRIVGVKDFQNHLWAPLDDLDVVTLDGELSVADILAEGDILTVRSNGNPELIGRCMLVGTLPEPTSHSGFTIRVRLLREDALPLYVCQFMKSRRVRRQLVDGGNGSNIKSLNQGALASIELTLPPIQMQRLVVKQLDTIGQETAHLADIARAKLTALDELKRSLLHQAFSGAL